MISVKLLCMIAESAYNATHVWGGSTLGEESKAWGVLDNSTKLKFVETVSNALEQKIDDPAVVHDNWLTAMIKDGWVYGTTYSTVDKTHPAMVVYEELDDGQKAKDELFLSVIKPFYKL